MTNDHAKSHRRDYEIEEDVRSFLETAWKPHGVSIQAIRNLMIKENLEIISSVDTIRQFKKDSSRKLTGEDDLRNMYQFFTAHPAGMALCVREATDSRLQKTINTSLQPKQTSWVRIAAAGVAKPECLTGNIRLASITIEGSQWGAGTVGLSVTIGCDDLRGFAVQRGRVAMDPGSGRLTRDGETYWALPREFTTSAYGQLGKVVATLRCSTRYDPFWDIIGVGLPIGKLETGADFAPLEGLQPGTEITVTFGTWLGDVYDASTKSDLSDHEWSFQTDGLAPVKPLPSTTSMEDPERFKRHLISLIRRTGLNAGPDGYVELSRCKLLVTEG